MDIKTGVANQRLIKWAGSILIIAIGISIAAYLTFKIRITEQTYYTVNMPEYLFSLKDGKKLKLRFGVGFADYEIAKLASKKHVEIISVLYKILNESESKQFTDPMETVKLKTTIIIELNRIKQPAEYISFLTKPTVL